MDPYHVLGINRDASQEEIKLAYRRVAMKWHPDRNRNSSESRERFHQAAEAYRLLYERATREKPADSKARESNERHDEYADHSDSGADSHGGDNGEQDEFADSVFWDVTLDYAIKLAQNGMSVGDITLSICRNGCPERIARTIADKAFNINEHYSAGTSSGKKGKAHPDQPSFKDERLDGELWRAFIGQRGFVLSARGAVEYYLVVFREFRQSANSNPLTWISLNKRLMKILNFSIVLFAILLTIVHFFPGPSQFKLLTDKDMLQVPLLVLPLMLAWMLYRKLWLAGLAFSLLYLVTLAWYDIAMPPALELGLAAVLTVAAVCYAPFVVLVLFANFLYYLKSLRRLHKARQLFPDHLDQLVWIKNRAGTSAAAAFLFVLVLASSLIQLAPDYWDLSLSGGSSRAAMQAQNNAVKREKVEQQVDEALQLFDIAEAHFTSSPPDYLKAEMAYSTAADNGSLLAAYKLGYMYYSGEGAKQNDVLAFDYFQQATRAPLAFQPHNLGITTRFLAESYNNLGIMYQRGLGTHKNLQQADKMFRRATEFGSNSAEKNLASLYQAKTDSTRRSLAYPEYR
jgi:curved DNA-binding protein CbpA